jgi:hypothetical protein
LEHAALGESGERFGQPRRRAAGPSGGDEQFTVGGEGLRRQRREERAGCDSIAG